MNRKLVALLLVCMMLISVPVMGSADSADALPEYSEITVEVFDRGTDDGRTDPTDNYYTDWIKEKALKELNIGVTFVAVSRWEETEQLNNRMAAGTAPDLCLTYSNELISNYRELGGLADLSAYVDTLLTDLKEFLGEDPSLPGRDLIERNKIMETGEIYSIPARRVNLARTVTFMRKDWLDALGLAVPTTTDEFYEALKAFKEQDPGGVGAENVIPFLIGSDDVRWRASTMLESFINPEISDDELWTNTVVDRYFLVDGYKEGMRFLNKLYNEGLTDTDFALYTDDVNGDNMIKSGVVGAYIHNWDQAYRDNPGHLRDLQVNVPGAEFVAVDCFTDSTGVTGKITYDPAGVNFFVPASSKNVEGALRYINWLSRFENYNYLQIGDEGVTYDLVDGLPKLKSAQGTDKIMNSSQNIDYTIMVNGLDLGDEEKSAKALTLSYSVDSGLVLDAYNAAMNNGKAAIVIPVTLVEAGPVTQTLIDKGKELTATSVRANVEDFDRVWDEGIADWLASGAQTVVDERAEKLAEYRGE